MWQRQQHTSTNETQIEYTHPRACIWIMYMCEESMLWGRTNAIKKALYIKYGNAKGAKMPASTGRHQEAENVPTAAIVGWDIFLQP